MPSTTYSMYSGYNKSNNVKSLLGNWVEEKALKETTGLTRYEPRSRELVPDRIITHTEREEPKSYKSVANSTYIRPDEITEFKAPPSLRPRDDRRMKEMQDAASKIEQAHQAEEEKKKEVRYLTSVNGSTYTAPSREHYSVSAHSRKSTSLAALSVESISFSRAELAALNQKKLSSGGLLSGAPITVYSHALATGAGLDLRTSPAGGAQLFARDAKFTNPIQDSRVKHAAGEDGDFLPTMPAPSVRQRVLLERLRSDACRLGSRASDCNSGIGHGIRWLSRSFRILARDEKCGALAPVDRRLGTNRMVSAAAPTTALGSLLTRGNSGFLSSGELGRALLSGGLEIVAAEMSELVSWLNYTGSGELYYPALIRALRGGLSDRRLNVIWNVFLGIEEAESRATSGLAGRSVDAAGKADAEPSVSLDFFIDSFVGGSRDELASQWDIGLDDDNRVKAGEFLEYCADLSAAIPAGELEDGRFESMLRDSWPY